MYEHLRVIALVADESIVSNILKVLYNQLILVSIDTMEEQSIKNMRFNLGNIIARSPRLDTVIMVEQFIKKHSGDYKKTELFHKLPKKMMWGTFSVILSYLWDNNNKIGIDKNDYVVYIWNPELAKKFASHTRY